MTRYFGTDGIRGRANQHPITPQFALNIALAAGAHLRKTQAVEHPKVVIGKDTRLSGYMLETALQAGFISAGANVILLGPLPTPAVAMLTRSMRADLGIMISASHNSYFDNGIKVFGSDGYKLCEQTQRAIENEIDAIIDSRSDDLGVDSTRIGKAQRLNDAAGRYIEAIKQSFPRSLTLSGLKLVVDCANGAGYRVAPVVLHELGAEVVPISVEPDGHNINHECGATFPQTLREEVAREGADLGLGLDGDADRLIVIDEKGQIIDGDSILGLIAKTWNGCDQLRGGGLAATIMSNTGLERFIEGQGLRFVRTQVGDRNVVKAMRDEGFNLGGEQSGHMVMSDYATTGDGLLAAVQVLAAIRDANLTASQAFALYDRVPQLFRSASYSGENPIERKAVVETVAHYREKLEAHKGRLHVRTSGTEHCIRVMGESEDESLVYQAVNDICDVISAA